MGNERPKASIAITADIGAMPFGTAGAGFGSRTRGCSIPSLEVENASVLDEFYWLDKDDPSRIGEHSAPFARRGVNIVIPTNWRET